MKFESLNDSMFESFSDEKSRSLRGGGTILGTNCGSSGGGVTDCIYDGRDIILVAV